MRKRHPNQPITNFIQVDDLGASFTQLENAGGEIAVTKMPPGMEWPVLLKVSDGNIHPIWKDDKNVSQ